MTTDLNLVFGVETVKFSNGREQHLVHCFDSRTFHNDHEKRGFLPSNIEIDPSIKFSQVPGKYELIKQPIFKYGRNFSFVVDCNFKAGVSIPQEKYSYLIIGIRDIVNYKPTPDSQPINGVKFWALNPRIIPEENYQGLRLIEARINNGKMADFPKLPGYYDIDFEEVRGKKGREELRAVKVNFIKEFNQNVSPPTEEKKD